MALRKVQNLGFREKHAQKIESVSLLSSYHSEQQIRIRKSADKSFIMPN